PPAERGRLPDRGGGAERDDRQADPGGRAREDPGHDRLRRQGERREPRRPRARRRAVRVVVLVSPRATCYPLTPEKQGRTRSSPPGPNGAGRFNRVRSDEETGRCMTAAFQFRKRDRRNKPDLVTTT